MRTLSIVVALVALVAVGAVGGFDYASHGKIGFLPSAWTNCCGSCCDDQSDCCVSESCCPLTASAEGLTCPITGEELPCPNCCPLNQPK